MRLQDKLSMDLKESIYNKDEFKKTFLRVIIGELNQLGKEVSDEDIYKLLKKLRSNAVLMNNKMEISFIDNYLPTKIAHDELVSIINNIIQAGNSTIGSVMGQLRSGYGVRVDMQDASKIIRGLL